MQDKNYIIDNRTYIALAVTVQSDEAPAIYRRTFVFGLVIGWGVAAIAGLFDYDTQSWVWSKNSGFKPFIFTKRR